jgi:hypothetical protein
VPLSTLIYLNRCEVSVSEQTDLFKLLRAYEISTLIYLNRCEVSVSEQADLRGKFGENLGKSYRLLYEI